MKKFSIPFTSEDVSTSDGCDALLKKILETGSRAVVLISYQSEAIDIFNRLQTSPYWTEDVSQVQ